MVGCFIIPSHIEARTYPNINHPHSHHSSQFRLIRRNLQPSSSEAGVENKIYDTAHGNDLPGTLLAEDNTQAHICSQNDCLYAWTNVAHTLKFLSEVLGYNSLDNNGCAIISSIHYLTAYNNCFWNGSQMVFGDGDLINFHNFTRDITVIAHELFHGVTQNLCDLVYQGEAGSINEHISDTFAVCVEQWLNNQTPQNASWTIGKLCMVGGNCALRTFDSSPAFINQGALGTDDQVKSMRNFYRGNEDGNGVHINSGILNHTFYLFSRALGENVWTIPCLIWWKTLATPGRLSPNSTFIQFACGTLQTAREDYGARPEVYNLLRHAWIVTGVIS